MLMKIMEQTELLYIAGGTTSTLKKDPDFFNTVKYIPNYHSN